MDKTLVKENVFYTFMAIAILNLVGAIALIFTGDSTEYIPVRIGIFVAESVLLFKLYIFSKTKAEYCDGKKIHVLIIFSFLMALFSLLKFLPLVVLIAVAYAYKAGKIIKCGKKTDNVISMIILVYIVSAILFNMVSHAAFIKEGEDTIGDVDLFDQAAISIKQSLKDLFSVLTEIDVLEEVEKEVESYEKDDTDVKKEEEDKKYKSKYKQTSYGRGNSHDYKHMKKHSRYNKQQYEAPLKDVKGYNKPTRHYTSPSAAYKGPQKPSYKPELQHQYQTKYRQRDVINGNLGSSTHINPQDIIQAPGRNLNQNLERVVDNEVRILPVFDQNGPTIQPVIDDNLRIQRLELGIPVNRPVMRNDVHTQPADLGLPVNRPAMRNNDANILPIDQHDAHILPFPPENGAGIQFRNNRMGCATCAL